MTSRTDIHSALVNLLGNINGVVTFSDRVKHWNDVSPSEQPAVFLSKGDELSDAGVAAKNELLYRLWVYVNEEDSTKGPAIKLSQVLDAIHDVIKPAPGQSILTLQGLVSCVEISGQTETDEGTLGNQAVAVVPLRVLMNK